MKSSLRSFLSLLLVAVVAFLAVSALRMWQKGRSPWLVFFPKDPHRPEKYTLPEKPPLELGDMDLLSRLNDEYAKLTQAVVPSVVSIDTAGVREQLLRDPWGRARVRREMTQGQGSGVIVTNEGHVVTNQHVISGQTQIQVTLHDGKSYPAVLIGEDSMLDLAVLKIEAPGPFTPLKLGDSSQVKVGQIVFAVGNPFGLSETVTQGIISAKERSISDQQRDLFQTDAAINPGNSGGPLVNLQGEIVGINVAIFSPDKENPGFQGVGFSIPSNDVGETLKQILEKGRPVHGFLGVHMHPLDARIRQAYGYTEDHGSLVIDTVKGSPAESTGLQARDVIMEYNGRKIQTPNQLISLVQRTPAGQEVPLKVWRAGEILELKTTITENIPAQLQSSAGDITKTREPMEIIRKYGILVRSFSAIESSRGYTGALVTEVDPHGFGSSMIQPNDIIIAINQNPVRHAQDFYRQFVASIAVQATQVTLIRNRETMTLTLQSLPRETVEKK
jgi:Do/DeqQ family serine protease